MTHKHTFDQLNNVLYNLKYNPLSRRHVVTLWNPDDIDDMINLEEVKRISENKSREGNISN